METLLQKSAERVAQTSLNFVRSIMKEIEWSYRFIGIIGSRGIGKTTLLLQYIKQNYPNDEHALYVSADNIWFSEHKLVELADTFSKRGGKYLFLDEIHKYPNWSQELKNIYDDFPTLKVVFTGSSMLEILNSKADLSRRAVVYYMQGLSYREFLNMNFQTGFETLNLVDILTKQRELASSILSKIKPLEHFTGYLQHGYYPFYNESPTLYYHRVEEIINMILEVELPMLRGVEVAYIPKIKQLLQIIAESVPFIPNVSKLSQRIGVERITFLNYLYYLAEAGLSKHLYVDADGINKLQKPDKIYLENTNLSYALVSANTDIGNIRETFFLNQLSYKNKIEYVNNGDFIANNTFTFEVGGKGKTNEQIKNVKNSFIISDNIEYGFGNKIPLWLFGFLY
ncbi:MAG: AAA family ATPase [Prevotellaceae bacterium]|jgi:predicted AAA+ superfamily ATPase|nr:AAA family ATPase [Prevotellaceae bacterium]